MRFIDDLLCNGYRRARRLAAAWYVGTTVAIAKWYRSAAAPRRVVIVMEKTRGECVGKARVERDAGICNVWRCRGFADSTVSETVPEVAFRGFLTEP